MPRFASFTATTWCPGVWPGVAITTTEPSPKTSKSSLFRIFVFGVAQRRVRRRLDDALRAVREHVVALGLLHDPGRVRELVGVARVVRVKVRQREVRDVARRVTRGGELRQHRLRRRHDAFDDGAAVALEVAIRNRAGVEHQRAARMHDQIRHVHEIDLLQLFAPEVEQRRVEAVDRAVLEDVDARRRPARAARAARRRRQCRKAAATSAPASQCLRAMVLLPS